MKTYKINGYGQSFIVKATSQAKAENKIHDLAIADGMIRDKLWVRELTKLDNKKANL